MSNTTIQIKRSSTTAIPTPGSLAAAELAYSYNSETLFIGTANGTQVEAIGGRYYLDLIKLAYDTANTGGGGSVLAYNTANGAFYHSNAAFDKANSANVLAFESAIGANNWANTLYTAALASGNAAAVSANAYALATFLPLTGGTISNDLVVSGNLTISGMTTYANTQTVLVGDNIMSLNADLPGDAAPTENSGIEVNRGSSSNAYLLWLENVDKWSINSGSGYLYIASNTDIEGVSLGANGYAVTVGQAGNNYTNQVGAASNTYADAVGVSANAYAALINGYANTNAANASYINTGTLGVLFGGTGRSSVTTNSLVYGNGTGPLQETGAGTEGQVLQASAAGVPTFAMLDGGTF